MTSVNISFMFYDFVIILNSKIENSSYNIMLFVCVIFFRTNYAKMPMCTHSSTIKRCVSEKISKR